MKKKSKTKQIDDDLLLTIRGNAPHGKVRIKLDFKCGKRIGFNQEALNVYLLSTIETIEQFRKEMCSESNEEWMKKNLPHYAREIERKKVSSYVT